MSAITSRRDFCHVLAGLILFGLGRPGPTASDPLARRLGRFFADPLSASMVGSEYLRSRPDEADGPRLVDMICSGSAERRAELAGADDEALRRFVVSQQRRDFEDGRVVKVRGWILSETECRLCALAAVSTGSA
jgi:hypothetical protein